MTKLHNFVATLFDMIDYESLYRCFLHGQMVPFYRMMYPGMLTFASRLLGPKLTFMAEDCVQDAILSTYEHRGDIGDAMHWRWYLLQCVRRRVSNLLRHSGVVDDYASSFVGDAEAGEKIEHDHSYWLMRQEALDTLFAAIERLPEQYKEIFSLNFEQGLKNQEIARLLDVAEITVKKRKARMLELLRSYLGPDADVLIMLYLMTKFSNLSVVK